MSESTNKEIVRLVKLAYRSHDPQEVRQIAGKLIEMSAYLEAGIVIGIAQKLERDMAVMA